MTTALLLPVALLAGLFALARELVSPDPLPGYVVAMVIVWALSLMALVYWARRADW
jgi:hypothetical protein